MLMSMFRSYVDYFFYIRGEAFCSTNKKRSSRKILPSSSRLTTGGTASERLTLSLLPLTKRTLMGISSLAECVRARARKILTAVCSTEGSIVARYK